MDIESLPGEIDEPDEEYFNELGINEDELCQIHKHKAPMLTMFPEQNWYAVKDGDAHCRWLFDRHYSRHHYKDGRKPKIFVGPGYKIVLVTSDGLALFIWRKFISMDGQKGINCAVFRNEGHVLSSLLILEAEQIAWQRWPGERLYTYINGHIVHGDGCCFKRAGWKKLKNRTKSGLIILEKWPAT